MKALLLAIAAVWVAVVLAVILTSSPAAKQPVETIYIINKAPRYMSDREIAKDIPAWEEAANKQFAPVWRSEHVKIVLLTHGRKAPHGAIVATFVRSGPIEGALAFHTVINGVPSITVYTGTGDYYGYNNSVSFTHELFELLGDPSTLQGNVGYADAIWLGKQQYQFPAGATWLNEVCDPVEAYDYQLHGVAISDWITPNWFGDQVAGGYDYMGVVHQPFTILRGGYAILVLDGQWYGLQNFRHAGRDADGFYRADDEDTKPFPLHD